MKLVKNSIFLLLAIAILASCSKNKFKVDVSDVKVDIAIKRFEQDLFKLQTENIQTGAKKLAEQYPNFYYLYFEKLVGFGNTQDSAYLKVVADYLGNKDINTLKKDVDSAYKNFEPTHAAVVQAFKYYKYHFPNAAIPKELITFMSQFNYGVITIDNSVGIGLDMFMGQSYKFYPSIGFPAYRLRKQTADYLPIAVVDGWLRNTYEPSTTDKTLLSTMVYEGKMLYLLDACFPDAPDTLKIGYTQKQLEWCGVYKSDMWANFLKDNALYESDLMKINKWLTEAPFTQGLNNDSAPQLGIWTGWQIVRQYMDNNPETTLEQLMAIKDAKVILKGSKYRP